MFKSLLKNTINKNRLLVENFSALSLLQIAEYVFPLITLPYLVRVLGPEKFGLVVFAQAFSLYFVLLVDYGFNLTATREISINRNNISQTSRIFCSVYFVKAILFLASLLIFLPIIIFIPKFSSDFIVYTFSFLAVLGNIMFPIWLFQGMEKMKYITIINVLIKGLFIIPIFLFIKSPNDYLYVPLINSLGLIFSGILAFVLSIKIFKLEIKKPSFSSVVCQFREGWHVFVSTIAVSIYTISTIFILGIFTNNTIVGYYSAAEKIIKAFRSLLNPISQAVYPHINKTASISKKRALIFINKLTNFVGAGTFVVSLLIFFSSGFIVKIFLGSQYAQSIVVLKILAFLPFLIGLSNILGIQTMLTFNFKKAFSRILVLAGALNVVLVFFLIPLFQHIGAAIALFITEFFVAIFMFLFLKKKGINIFNVNRYE